MAVMGSLGTLNGLCCSNTNSSLMHMFSPSGLVPKLSDDLHGISPGAGLGNGGKYTQPGILLSKKREVETRPQRPGGLEPETGL